MSSLRIDAAELIPGALVIGSTGLGVLGSAIPATGQHGASILFNDIDPGDEDKEFRALVGSVSLPAGAKLFVHEDGAVETTGATDGTYTIPYTLYVDGVLIGSTTATVTVGNVVAPPADTTSPAWPGGAAITHSNVSTTGCTVTWPAATDAGSVSYRWRVNGGTWTPTTATSATISGQTAGATITVDVQAFDNAATPNYSTTLTKQISLQQPQVVDTTGPAWVGANPEIVITSLSSTGYTATAPGATDAGGSITYRWTLGGVVQAGVAGATFTRSGATPGSTEALTVAALDPGGNPSTPLNKQVTLQSGVGGGDVSALEARVAQLEARLDAMLAAGLVRYDSGKLRVYS